MVHHAASELTRLSILRTGAACVGRALLALLPGLGLSAVHCTAHAQYPLANIASVDGGGAHTCALTLGGGLQCWGLNSRGQLGDGTQIQRLTAVDVSDLNTGVSAVATGFFHSCARSLAGGIKCWGFNFNGQLGDGTTTQRLTAVDVSGLTVGVTAITTGNNHSCARTTGGGVKCWGSNDSGQIGDGSTTNRSLAIDVSGLTSGVSAISAGDKHTCALTTNGGVKCWGRNVEGQLGDGTQSQRLTAVDVSGLTSGVAAIAVGELHSCALSTGGGVKCWGSNVVGQIGDGTTTRRLTAVDVDGLGSGVGAITVGGAHSCALITGGGVKCWGSNSNGQLGDGTTTNRLTAVDVSDLGSGVGTIAAGRAHTCAITVDSRVKCWGNNFNGQLGDGTQIDRSTPVDVLVLPMFQSGFESTP